MVHSLAVPQTDERGLCKLVAVGRGDGCISMYDADLKAAPAARGSSGSGGGGKKSGKKGGQKAAAVAAPGVVPGRLALLGREQGGHSAAVNSVSFLQGSGWQQLLSAGNDCRLLLWNWGAAQEGAQVAAEAAAEAAEVGGGGDSSLRQGGNLQQQQSQCAQQAAATDEPSGSASVPLLAAEHQHSRKINWACSTALPGCPYNVFLADTGRRLTALKLA